MEFRTGPKHDPATITVNMADRGALFAEVGRRLQAGEGFALATLNLDHLVKLGASAEFRAAYLAQDLVTADGNPIVWMSRMARRPVALLPGADLVLPLCRLCAEAGRKVALIGSTEESLDRAAQELSIRVPGLRVGLTHAPPMGFDPTGDEALSLLDRLAAEGIGLCFLALGAPKQEAFAALGRSRAPGVGFASIGAGLDFLSGHQRRAPSWVRRLQMEWLWRMLTNPRRLALRYIRAGLILPGHMIGALRQRS